MPIPVAAKAGVIAISVAVAAAIAVYESPEIRRMAEDLRRRIAIALHSLGDGLDPASQSSREPLFNRPEDAEGFLRSRGAAGNEPGLDADDETRRRQREELMYWNAIRESKKEMERKEAEEKRRSRHGSASTFDDFLHPDTNAEKGTYVYNTGTDVRGDENEGLVRRRGVEGVRGLSPAIYANPFADEHCVDDFDDEQAVSLHPLTPGRDEIMSDIYNASEPDRTAASHTLSPEPPQPAAEVLFDFNNSEPADDDNVEQEQRQHADEQYLAAGGDERLEAYASIQAWAQNSSNTGFYSPLPVSPPVPLSEPEIISEGVLTPTDSGSTVGSGEDIVDEAVSQTADGERVYDVLSEDESVGMATPVSWSEIGSVVSSNDDAGHA